MRRARCVFAVLSVAMLALALPGCSLMGGANRSGAADVVKEGTQTVVTTPPAAPTATVQPRVMRMDGKRDVMDTMDSAPDLTIFCRLLRASGLAVGLHKLKSVTVLAPNNDAFEELGPEAVARLLEAKNLETLRKIMRNHFIAYAIPAEQLVTIGRPMTFQGGRLSVTQSSGTTIIGGGTVLLRPDVPAKNGTVHVVNGVLLPKGMKP